MVGVLTYCNFVLLEEDVNLFVRSAKVCNEHIEIVIKGGWVAENLALHEGLRTEVDGDIWPGGGIEFCSKSFGKLPVLELMSLEMAQLEGMDVVVQLGWTVRPD